MKRITQLSTGVTAILALVFSIFGVVHSPNTSSAQQAAQQQDEVTLTLLHNNDGESKLLPNPDAGYPGVARFSQKLQDLGTSSGADILLRVTSGDNFLASKELSVSLNNPDKPMYDALALSGLYEVMGLGNHDFDFGPELAKRFIGDFDPPVTFVAANLDVSGSELSDLATSGRIAKSKIVKDPVSGEEIAVIGAVTPRLANISSPGAVTINPNVAEAVNAEAERLTKEGYTRIVLVSHMQGLSQDRDLVPQLKNIDIVVAGGGDELLKNEGDTCLSDEDAYDSYPLVLKDADGVEVPVVTAPGGYRCIGQLDVVFDADGAVKSFTGTSHGVALDGPAEALAKDTVEAPLAAAVSEMTQNVIGTSEVDLDGRKPEIRTRSTNLGELMADSLLSAGAKAENPAVVAIQNGGGIRNDSVIPAGDLSTATTFDVAPFANFVGTVEVPRERFKEILEVGVSGLPEAEGTFPQIAGFNMTVDASKPAREVARDGDCSLTGSEGERVRDVALSDGTVIVKDGQVVDGEPLVLATIDFLARGGDCYPLGDLDFKPVGASYQQALASFIEDGLGGTVTSGAYPSEGLRVTMADAAAAAEPTPTPAPTATPEPAKEEPAKEETKEDLARTGVNSWIYLLAATTTTVGGALVIRESRNTSKLSLANRLRATAAWFPERDRD